MSALLDSILRARSCSRSFRRPRHDLFDRRFTRLVAESYIGKGNWRCLCDCGRRTVVRGTNLRYGKTKSCGCLKHGPSAHRHIVAIRRKIAGADVHGVEVFPASYINKVRGLIERSKYLKMSEHAADLRNKAYRIFVYDDTLYVVRVK